jgi:hypothetical protein
LKTLKYSTFGAGMDLIHEGGGCGGGGDDDDDDDDGELLDVTGTPTTIHLKFMKYFLSVCKVTCCYSKVSNLLLMLI